VSVYTGLGGALIVAGLGMAVAARP
jgi:hypothetical protein